MRPAGVIIVATFPIWKQWSFSQVGSAVIVILHNQRLHRHHLK